MTVLLFKGKAADVFKEIALCARIIPDVKLKRLEPKIKEGK